MGKVPISQNRWVRAVAVAVLLVVGTLLFLPVNAFQRVQPWGIDISIIDDTWTTNIAWRLKYGEIAGRDFVYTYGPLWQVLHATGLWLGNRDAASLYRYLYLVECFLVAASVWGLLGFSGASFRWRAGLFLAWMVFLSPIEHLYIGLRPHGALFILGACGYLAVAGGASGKIRGLVLWGGAAPVFLLYSFDSGVYGLAALIGLGISLAAVSFNGGTEFTELRSRALKLLGASLVGLVVFAVLLRGLPGWGGYFSNSWQVASGYAAVMALGGDWRSLLTLGLSVVIQLATIVWCSLRIRKTFATDPVEASRSAAFLGIAWFGLFFARGGITRSDEAHVALGCIPAIFLLCILGTAHASALGRKWAPAWALAIVPFWVLLENPARYFSLVPLASTAYAVQTKVPRAIGWEWGTPTLRISNPFVQDGVATIAVGSEEQLYSWPNFGLMNVLLDKKSPDFTVQTYTAHTEGLERKTIENLQKTPDVEVYFPYYDHGLNGVQSCSRNPMIFRYLLENFEVGPVGPKGSALLVRRGQGKSVQWKEIPVDVEATTVLPATGKAATLKTRNGGGLGTFGDFFVLYLRCPSSPLLALAKPGQVSVGFQLKDQSGLKNVFQRLALPADGKEHAILVRAQTVQDTGFVNAFARKPVTTGGAEIAAMGLIWEPLDALSVRPPKIDLLKVTRLVPAG